MKIDTRTYSEIYKSLSEFEKKKLTVALLSELLVTSDSLRSYRVGRRIPDAHKQKTIERVIREVLKINASVHYLFPDSPYAQSLRKN